MNNPSSAFVFQPDIFYVVGLDAALNFPEFFDPEASLPERHLVISQRYPDELYEMRNEKSDRGIAANELIIYIHQLLVNGEQRQIDGAHEYTIGNVHMVYDDQFHSYDHLHQKGEHIKDCIVLAEHWKKQKDTNGAVVILTNDPLMQIMAQNLNLDIVMFSPTPYIGYRRIHDERAITYWRKSGRMTGDVFRDFLPDAEALKPHEFVMFGKTNGFGHIGRYDASIDTIVPLTYYKNIQGITPIGELQAMAFEALLAPADEISVVILYGNAGAGKTFAAISSAIAMSGLADIKTVMPPPETANGKQARPNGKRARKQQATTMEDLVPFIIPPPGAEDYPYQGVMVCPPDRMLGDKMAAVPGDERAKLAGKMNGYMDNIRAFLRSRKDKKDGGIQPTERDFAIRATNIMNRIEICPPGEINGRSFWNTFFICDEAQFNSLAQIKACIERCDNGTKLALCGDPSQISNPFGWHGNPLARAVRYLGSDPNVAIIRFDGESEIKRPGAKIIARSWPR